MDLQGQHARAEEVLLTLVEDIGHDRAVDLMDQAASARDDPILVPVVRLDLCEELLRISQRAEDLDLTLAIADRDLLPAHGQHPATMLVIIRSGPPAIG